MEEVQRRTSRASVADAVQNEFFLLTILFEVGTVYVFVGAVATVFAELRRGRSTRACHR
jgi:hypothetical protein